MSKFIKVNGSSYITYLNKDAIDGIMLHVPHKDELHGRHSIILSGRWISVREEFETLEEAQKRYTEILSQLEE